MAWGLLEPHVSLIGGTYKKSSAWEWELGKPRGVIRGFGRRHRRGSFLLRFLRPGFNGDSPTHFSKTASLTRLAVSFPCLVGERLCFIPTRKQTSAADSLPFF